MRRIGEDDDDDDWTLMTARPKNRGEAGKAIDVNWCDSKRAMIMFTTVYRL